MVASTSRPPTRVSRTSSHNTHAPSSPPTATPAQTRADRNPTLPLCPCAEPRSRVSTGGFRRRPTELGALEDLPPRGERPACDVQRRIPVAWSSPTYVVTKLCGGSLGGRGASATGRRVAFLALATAG